MLLQRIKHCVHAVVKLMIVSTQMSRHLLMSILLVASIICVVLGLATLWPTSAPKISDLGYSTWCPFAPWSTITLLFLAWLGWVVWKHIKSLPE